MIAIGSNIDPDKNIQKALSLLNEAGLIIQRTDFVTTKPVILTDQPDFLNGAVLIQTKLNYYDLLYSLKQIEQIIGRKKTESKYAPREIDLDITTFNSFLVDDGYKELAVLRDFIRELRPNLKLN